MKFQVSSAWAFPFSRLLLRARMPVHTEQDMESVMAVVMPWVTLLDTRAVTPIGHAGGHAIGHSGGAAHSAGGAAGHGAGSGAGHGAGQQGGHAVGKAVGDGINHALGHSLGHMVGGHSSGVAGHAAGGGAGGNAQGSGVQGMSGSTHAITGTMRTTKERLNLWELVLAVLNLMRVASFAFFFGLTGYLCITKFPWLGFLTLIPALVAGYIGSNLILYTFGYLYQKMQVSSLAIVENMVGQLGEVTVPVPAGRIGAITYVIESKRYSSSARAVNPTHALKKGDKIMIAEIRDSVAYVEPWNEDLSEIEIQNELAETVDTKESVPVQELQQPQQ